MNTVGDAGTLTLDGVADGVSDAYGVTTKDEMVAAEISAEDGGTVVVPMV